jgi:MFS transporter, putative metabolite transport protein
VAINVLVVVANIVGVLWIIDKFGRRAIAIVPSLVIGVTLVVVAMASDNPVVVVGGFALVTILNSGFVVGAYYAWGSELFPTSVRGTSLGISNGAGKFGSVLGVSMFPVLFAKSPTWSFLLLAGLIFLNVITLLVAAPETKGISLDELEGATGSGDRA